MSSPTFGVALDRIARYTRLAHGSGFTVRRDRDLVTLVFTPTLPIRPYTRGKIDMEMATIVTFGRDLTGSPLIPVRLTLACPPPSYAARYDEVFGCPVRFDAPLDSLVLTGADLQRPLVSAHAEVSSLFERRAEADLFDLDCSATVSRVRKVVRTMLPSGEPSLAGVASQLAMSTRTLQRRLADETTRFFDIVDDVREEAATHYLRRRSVSNVEVAYLLGFADPTSYFRAFKRWTGTTPEAYRTTLLQPIHPAVPGTPAPRDPTPRTPHG
jgi:AraC-like DNA-binding protein